MRIRPLLWVATFSLTFLSTIARAEPRRSIGVDRSRWASGGFSQPPPGWQGGFSASVSGSASVSFGLGPDPAQTPRCDLPYQTPPPECCSDPPPAAVVTSGPRHRPRPIQFMGQRAIFGSARAPGHDTQQFYGLGAFSRTAVNRYFAVESGLDLMGRREDRGIGGIDRLDVPLTLGLTLALTDRDTAFRPKVGAGVGGAYAYASDELRSASDWYALTYLSAGFEARLGRRVWFDLELRSVERYNDDTSDSNWTSTDKTVLEPLLHADEELRELRVGVAILF